MAAKASICSAFVWNRKNSWKRKLFIETEEEFEWQRGILWLSRGAAGVRKWWAILLYHRTLSPPAAPLAVIWQQTTSNCSCTRRKGEVLSSNKEKEINARNWHGSAVSDHLHLFRIMSRQHQNLLLHSFESKEKSFIYKNRNMCCERTQRAVGCQKLKIF